MKDGDRLRGLSTVRVSKKFLLTTLKTNRDKHEKAWNGIMDVRQKKLIEDYEALYDKIKEQINKRLEKIKADRNYTPSALKTHVEAPRPEKHTKDYDQVITLVGASLDSEFELSSSEFNQYVNDDWSWKNSFILTASGCGINYS
jgi:hypothetical protein